jgi:membrane-associated phospholipid phosphatase
MSNLSDTVDERLDQEIGDTRLPAPVPMKELRLAWVIGGGAFVGLSLVALRRKPNPVDVAITSWLQRTASPEFARAMKLISAPGYAPFTHSVVISTAINLWALGRRRDAAFSMLTMGAGFTTGMVKLLVGRPRPEGKFRMHNRTFKDNSFPSGHTTHYTAYYGYILFLAYEHLPSGPLRFLVMAYCASLICLVGPSRIYLGHHWASDVTAGYLVGFTYLTGMLQVYEALDRLIEA